MARLPWMQRLVLLHASIGALMGALLSLYIPVFDPVPVAALSCWIAVGSGISSFIVLSMDHARRGPERKAR